MQKPFSAADSGRHQRGFTLIEVMMVVVLIGVITAVVAFSLTPDSSRQRMEQEQVKLSDLFDQFSQEATVSQQPVGITIEAAGIRLWSYDDQAMKWSALESPKIKPEYALEEGYRLTIQTTSSNALGGETLSGQAAIHPDAIFLPTGEVTPVRFQISDDSGQSNLLELDELGRLTVKEDGFPKPRQ